MHKAHITQQQLRAAVLAQTSVKSNGKPLDSRETILKSKDKKIMKGQIRD